MTEDERAGHTAEQLGAWGLLNPLMESTKFDKGKLPWELMPMESLDALLEVLDYGARKYSDENWRRLSNFNNRYFAAAMRHLSLWRQGEKVDPESGLTHLAHALTNLAFLVWKERTSD